MHRAAYEALGLSFAYVPFAVESRDLPGALTGMRALGIRGFGVSMPFKLEVLDLADAIDPLAKKIGAANTLVNDDGFVTAHNTDAEGAARALEELMTTLRGARCLVLGAGGAARAVAHGLASRGAIVMLANRTDSRASDLAKEVSGEATAIAWSERGDAHADVVVNASSGGMDTGGGAPASPFEEAWIRKDLVVMDIVYKPTETALVLAARRRGARTIHGGRMLLHQAARQFELYTDRPAPLAAMNAAIRRATG